MAHDVGKDPYLDKESGVLRNLLNLKTEQALEDAEARVTSVEITLLTSENVPPYDELMLNYFYLYTANFLKTSTNELGSYGP